MLVGMANAQKDQQCPSNSPSPGNFRLFMASQVASYSGTWLQLVALAWLASELTGSGTALGGIVVAIFGPLLLLGLWTGALADRVDKHRLLIAVQSLIAVQAAVLGVAILGGVDSVVAVYTLTLIYGVLHAVEVPARRAFVPELVEQERITRAVSINSAITTGGRVVGPLCAGVLIASAGIGWCFIVNAACYVVSLVGLLLIRRSRLRITKAPKEPGAVRAGLRYAWRVPDLRIAILLTAIVATFGFNHQVVVPLLVEDKLGGGVGAYSLLYVAITLGSVFGALAVARRSRIDLKFLAQAIFAFAVTNAVIAVSPNLVIATLAAVATGFTALLFITAATAMQQQRCAPEMRGRLMALNAMVLVGGLPVGAPIIGAIADLAGVGIAVAVGSVVSLVAVILVLVHLVAGDAGPKTSQLGVLGPRESPAHRPRFRRDGLVLAGSACVLRAGEVDAPAFPQRQRRTHRLVG